MPTAAPSLEQAAPAAGRGSGRELLPSLPIARARNNGGLVSIPAFASCHSGYVESYTLLHTNKWVQPRRKQPGAATASTCSQVSRGRGVCTCSKGSTKLTGGLGSPAACPELWSLPPNTGNHLLSQGQDSHKFGSPSRQQQRTQLF